jgi:sporulation protein YtfJ
MADHPIQGLMITAMENLKEMVDVTKVVGDAVTFGFVTGGSEFDAGEEEKKAPAQNQQAFPFGGGSGGGVSIHPMAFLVVGPGEIRLLPVDRSAIFERLIDLAPQVFHYLQELIKPEEEKRANFKL